MAESFSKRLSWRVEAAAHSAVAALMRLLSAESVFIFGEFLGEVVWPLMKKRQKTIARNLRIATEGKYSPDEIDVMAQRSFVRTVANLLCSSVSAKAAGEDLTELLEVENPEVMAEALAEGNGVVLLLSHMGNWELLTRLKAFDTGIENLGGFYRPLNNPILNERVLRERQFDGSRLFSKRDSLHIVSGFLKDNGVVGILADQRVGFQGKVAGFFGRLTRSSPLPSLLARRCKSEVLALSMVTVEPGKWKARYHRVEKPYTTVSCSEALERAMKVSMEDVFWLQERWKVYFSEAVPPTKWLEKAEARGRSPHRALVWMSEEEKDMELPAGCIHGDIVNERCVGAQPWDLENIDRSKPLPVDYILTFSDDKDLTKAAKELGIPVYPVSLFSE
jgi:Kdo2-lipid IVA lauroyltransferase/acyltransferase